LILKNPSFWRILSLAREKSDQKKELESVPAIRENWLKPLKEPDF